MPQKCVSSLPHQRHLPVVGPYSDRFGYFSCSLITLLFLRGLIYFWKDWRHGSSSRNTLDARRNGLIGTGRVPLRLAWRDRLASFQSRFEIARLDTCSKGSLGSAATCSCMDSVLLRSLSEPMGWKTICTSSLTHRRTGPRILLCNTADQRKNEAE